MEYTKRFIKGCIIPGIVFEILIIVSPFIMSILDYNPSYLNYPIGGPKGMMAEMLVLLLLLSTSCFLLFSGIWAIRILLGYRKGNERTGKRIMNFLFYALMTLSIMLAYIVYGACLSRGYDILNMTMFYSTTAVIVLCLCWFAYWLILLYRVYGISFFSKQTAGAFALAVGLNLYWGVLWLV